MADNFVSNVLEGLKIAQNRSQHEAQTELETKRLEAEKKWHVDQLKQQKEIFDANHQLATQRMQALKSQAAVSLLQAKQEVMKAGLKGEPIPGDVVEPAAQTSEGAYYSPANPAQATQQLHTVSLGEGQQPIQVTMPTPEEFAKRQASIQDTLIEPKTKATIAIQAAKEAEETKRQLQLKEEDFKRTREAKAWDDARNEATINSREQIARNHEITMLKIAGMKEGSPEGMANTEHFVQGLGDGTYTRDDINRSFPKDKRIAEHVIQTAALSGIVPLSKEQQGLVGEYQNLVGNIKLMDEFIANTSQTHNRVSAYGAGIANTMNDKLTTLESELQGRGSIIARGLGKEKGNLSNQDIQRISKGYLVNRFNTIERNVDMRNSYVSDLVDILKAKLSNLPKAQQDVILGKVGLTNVPMYKQVNKSSTAAPQTSYTPESLELMRKHGLPLPQGVQ